jgi:hypothetical protein
LRTRAADMHADEIGPQGRGGKWFRPRIFLANLRLPGRGCARFPPPHL